MTKCDLHGRSAPSVRFGYLYICYLLPEGGALCVFQHLLCWVGTQTYREGLCSCLVLTSAHSSLLPASIVEICFSDVFVVITLVKEWKGNVGCVDVSRAGGSPWGTAGGGTLEATELIISPPTCILYYYYCV